MNQYLRLYAEAETALLADFPARHWHYNLLIPAFAEDCTFFQQLRADVLNSHCCLTVLVVNQPDSLPGIDPRNQQLMEVVLASGHCGWRRGNLALVDLTGCASAVLLVDRSTHPIPKKQGVGLARKIAADLACVLIERRHLASPWLCCTDADVQLPGNYFAALPEDTSAAACLYPFRHQCDDSPLGRATSLYEWSLHYYVNGLKAAKSPYGFHTIGSTLAINSNHYQQVRGFPKRSGGEDFYLLNKLAKTGSIVELTAPTITIAARSSHRVPFGTGPAVAKILAMTYPNREFTVYNPKIFQELAQWLALMPTLWGSDSALEQLSPQSRCALLALGATDAIAHSRRQSKDAAGFEKQMTIWFDGFMTLKFVHALQAAGFSQVGLQH